MADRSLIEAFRIHVLEDDGFRRAIDEASAIKWLDGQHSMAWVMREGVFPSTSGRWPVDVDPIDLSHAWFSDQTKELLASKPYALPADRMDPEAAKLTIRRAAELAGEVVAVFHRFLAPLRSGVTRAVGIPAGGAPSDIPRTVWQRPTTLINIARGEIGRSDDPDDLFESDIILEYTAVQLSEAPVVRFSSPNRNREKEKIRWDMAIDQVMFKIYNGKKYKNRQAFVTEVLDLLNDGRDQVNPTQVMNFFAKFYRSFWTLLRDE